MAAAKKSTKKAAKKAPAKKAAKKTTKKSTAKKSTARKSSAKKSTKKAAKKTTAASANVQLVVASRIKEAARNNEIRVAGDFADAFNAEVNEMLERAITRAKSNNRGTVRPGDL